MSSIDYIGHDWNSLQGKLKFGWHTRNIPLYNPNFCKGVIQTTFDYFDIV